MKEHPIIFTAESVRAILAGRKTQTRRVVNPQPSAECGFAGVEGFNDYLPCGDDGEPIMPRWRVGDYLWVRETWAKGEDFGANGEGPFYRATDPGWDDTAEYVRWRSPIFMPRLVSRLMLKITGAKVERLQDISANDCISEGVSSSLREHDAVVDLAGKYSALWDSINGKRPGCRWQDNPWVWVLSFKKLEGKA